MCVSRVSANAQWACPHLTSSLVLMPLLQMQYVPLADIEEAAARQAAYNTAKNAQDEEEDGEDMTERSAVYKLFTFLRSGTYYEKQGR